MPWGASVWRFAAIAGLLASTPLAAAPSLRLEPAATPAQTGAIALGTADLKDMPPESWHRQDSLLGVRNISHATLTPFLPAPGKGTGAAVIVAPGGGFLGLAIQAEGYDVARWLADHGVAAFVLKYRTLPTPADFPTFHRAMEDVMSGKPSPEMKLPKTTPAFVIEDGLAALKLVRAKAAQRRIDPAHIGMMGFSAGGFTAIDVALTAQPAERPAFIAPIYGPMNPVTVPADAPPLFIVTTADDFLLAEGGLGLPDSWRRAGRPVELHLYSAGGHGFGLGKPGTTTVGWIENFRRWLDASGFLKGMH